MTSKTAPHTYTESFYALHEAGSARSASAVLSHLYRWVAPRSVIDIGCGQGAWLAAAERLGSQILVGLDGPWVDQATLDSPTISFRPTDLEQDVELTERYDLCISVEVAEHLSPERARPFVNTLCRASDVVLFSAATPFQTGLHHVNLRWPTFWVDLFAASHYTCFDRLRPLVWNDADVDWWYRQNVLVFVRNDSPLIDAIGSRVVEPMLDVVHPAHLASIDQEYQEQLARPTLQFCLACLKRWALARIGA